MQNTCNIEMWGTVTVKKLSSDNNKLNNINVYGEETDQEQ